MTSFNWNIRSILNDPERDKRNEDISKKYVAQKKKVRELMIQFINKYNPEAQNLIEGINKEFDQNPRNLVVDIKWILAEFRGRNITFSAEDHEILKMLLVE